MALIREGQRGTLIIRHVHLSAGTFLGNMFGLEVLRDLLPRLILLPGNPDT